MSKTLKINIPEVDGDIVISVRAIKPLHPIIKQEALSIYLLPNNFLQIFQQLKR